jgi:hypothetical protein
MEREINASVRNRIRIFARTFSRKGAGVAAVMVCGFMN